MARILIIEDESKIARFIELELQYEGYEVEIAADGRSGLEKARCSAVDLIVLDLMLPCLSGIEVCRKVRAESDVPIIMLTAKDDINDKVTGLDMGADDYMTKPFAIEELLARIRNLLQRQQRMLSRQEGIQKMGNTEENEQLLRCGELQVNLLAHTVTCCGREIVLTKREFDLLEYMLRNRNIVLSRDRLLEQVWGFDYGGETNVVDVYIRYLRSKIDIPCQTGYIKTVRGLGYVLKG